MQNNLLKNLKGFPAYLKRCYKRATTMDKIAKICAALIVLFIILFATCSCSPQKQLTNLLIRHPELRQDTCLLIKAPHILHADSASIPFTITDLGGSSMQTHSQEQSRQRPQDLTVATASGATATISATGKQTPQGEDIYNLSVRQPADTIFITDTITIPAYITKTEYKDRVIAQMNKPQKFFFGIGILITFLAILIITLRIIARIKYGNI